MNDKPIFQFGRNWESFSRIVNEERLLAARQSLAGLLGDDGLRSRSFLDIGCGSGLFSIAAAQLGAERVTGIDLDPVSVETSLKNTEKEA